MAAESSRMFYVASITLVGKTPVSKLSREYLRYFKQRKRKIAISIENPPMVRSNQAFLLGIVKRYADILFLNDSEARELLGKDFEKKLYRLKRTIPIFLKRGSKGSMLYIDGRRRKIPALKAKVLDTTGAGDAYAAGTLYGISRGFSPLSSAKMGCYLATRVVEKFGAGIPYAHARLTIKHKKKKR
jgi:sugar/nucleoside kinase (ribokinase family)